MIFLNIKKKKVLTPAVLFSDGGAFAGSRAPPFLTKTKTSCCPWGGLLGPFRAWCVYLCCPLSIDGQIFYWPLAVASSHFRKGACCSTHQVLTRRMETKRPLFFTRLLECETCVLDYDPASTPAVKLYSENSVVLYKHGMYSEPVCLAISIASICI